MPKFSEKAKQEVYSSLLANGERLFNLKGFQLVTAEEIALSSGIAKGTFYHFFNNKEHLYIVLNNKIQKQIFEKTEQMIQHSTIADQSERFYAILCYVLDAFIENPIVMEVDFSVWKRIEEKAPKECIEENQHRDEQVLQLLESSGFCFQYDLKTTTKILQNQFVQFATMKQEPDCLSLTRIVFRALSEHLIQRNANTKEENP